MQPILYGYFSFDDGSGPSGCLLCAFLESFHLVGSQKISGDVPFKGRVKILCLQALQDVVDIGSDGRIND